MTETALVYQTGGGSWKPVWRALGWTALLFAAACLADPWVYENIHNPKVYDRDWGRLLRVMGFLGTWLAIALAVALQEGGEEARRALAKRRATLLLLSAALGGLLAEVLKLTFRRERPEIHDGEYGFRAFSERTWSTAGLALPSSHALVAFAGAAMLARLFPRARWVGYTLAVGCAATRVLAHAHFLSDVVMAAGMGWIVAYVLDRRWPVAGPIDRGLLRRAALGIALLAVTACDSSLSFSPLGEQMRLTSARERWMRRAPATYSFTMARDCFCEETREMRVSVVNGAVVSVRPIGSQEELTGPARDSFKPIPALYDLVLDAIIRPAYSIRAAYDPALGFPSEVFIDYERNIADEEYGFRVRDVDFP